MKKVFSILFALVIILSGTHVTIATHFCGGVVAATEVTLSGKLASCGMEAYEDTCPLPGNHLTNHCCDDQLTTIGTVNIFTYPVSLSEEYHQNSREVHYLLTDQLFHSITTLKPIYTSFNPPGRFMTSAVTPEDICVFRI